MIGVAVVPLALAAGIGFELAYPGDFGYRFHGGSPAWPTWVALGFRASPEGAPHAYSFEFVSNLGPSRSAFVARAHGDLDGDGVTSTFEVRGHASEGDPSGPAVEPGMRIEAETE